MYVLGPEKGMQIFSSFTRNFTVEMCELLFGARRQIQVSGLGLEVSIFIVWLVFRVKIWLEVRSGCLDSRRAAVSASRGSPDSKAS